MSTDAPAPVLPPQHTAQLGQSNMLRCRNYVDENNKPAGGYAQGPGLTITWQDGPRGKRLDGSLLPANGAFVEDAIAAAHQRLAFFQASEFIHPDNAEAMTHLEHAIACLARRASARAQRGVLGQNVV